MTGLEHAILGLRQALDAPRRHHVWRWLVRHRMAAVKDALAAEGMRDDDAWLAARELTLQRERTSLLRRLVSDLERHRQRLNDLVYDSVTLELGGSE